MNTNLKSGLKIDKRVADLLAAIGLTDKEVKLLLICMNRSEVTIDLLMYESGLKRPTVYYVMQTLLLKGLVSEAKESGRLKYKATSIEGLHQFTQRQSKQMTDYGDEIVNLSHLFPLHEASVPKSSVEQFSGIEGIKAAIEKALYCKQREWLIVAPSSQNNFLGQFDKQYWDYFMKTRESRDIKARSLWEYERKLSRTVGLKDILTRKPRYLPKELKGMFKSIMIVYDKKVLFITSLEEKNAVIITSDELSSMMTAFFEGLWLSSHKIFNS